MSNPPKDKTRQELAKELNRLLSQEVGNEADIMRFVDQHWLELNQEPESVRRPVRY